MPHLQLSHSRTERRLSGGVVCAMLASAIMIAGCTEVQDVADEAARTPARAAVDQVLVINFPGIDGSSVTPYTDCIIDGASTGDLASLASDAVVGVDQDTVALVTEIAQRPAVASCFAQAALPT